MMKKNFQYAWLSAIALTSAVAFTGCSSDDDAVNNPNYDPQTDAVKTSFTISVGDVKQNTRMTADAVQQDQEFNGMEDVYLFPFISSADLSSTSVTSESYIHLGDIDGFDTKVLKAKGKIYQDISFSVGVNKFVFYGASKTRGNGDLKASYLKMDKKTAWASDWNPEPLLTNSTLNNVHFDLVPIQKDKALADVKTAGASTIAPLNAVDVAIAEQITNAATATPATIVTDLQEIQKVLRNDKSATTTPNYKPYAGSSASMKALMTDLYNTVVNMETTLTSTDATPVNYATPILTAIENSFNATPTTATDYTLEWKTDPKFPSDASTLDVPDGAVAVQYIAANNQFEYVEPSVDGMAVASVSRYTYPARLYYRANTVAKVRDTEFLTTLADQYNTWAEVVDDVNYTTGPVTATTRSVVMTDQVEYAVGRLDVQVRVKPSATITDNAAPISQPVTVPAGGYKLTGVLIGGQKQVDWEFKPITSATEMTIWDNTMDKDIYAKQQSDYSDPNYTLALETVEKGTGETGAVNIALEFENTGNDFCGVDHNLIPAGTKFYLVARLEPGQKEAANPNTISQVFKQDYITTAKLTISENSLKNAYNVIPDLRSPKLEFGLSVNLEWKQGITFEQEFQ